MSSPKPESSPTSSLRDYLGTRRNIVASILMLAASLCLVAFHFAPITGSFH